MARRVATVGAFVALALIFSYVEAIIPFNFGIPGIKLGLANLVIVTGLYFLNYKDVCIISLLRIFISGLLFGNGLSLIYSISGGLLSLIVMIIFKKTNIFSVVGVSIVGAVFHNISQIIAAAFVIQTSVVVIYLPILMIAGVGTGFLIGFISSNLLPILIKQNTRQFH
ncbi:MAG: Gx transporter family protein [Ruminococcus sp.]|nr:Gx transporter family protein [Ruminococcus sp.]